jgi:hypothetical protein
LLIVKGLLTLGSIIKGIIHTNLSISKRKNERNSAKI